MTDQRPEMAVIADLPADLRHALLKDFALVDEPLEGANAIAIACHHGPNRADGVSADRLNPDQPLSADRACCA